ncbi:MAG: [acyl-carrier-protein] S-malonyltransferase [Firmicutes bacterium HGW-Firmicutes-12]|jgi:[acyl-carrier-protein] S-malonyltransferase|nr:MAG: [acyl-carrier-protein] S-malonyltransferase [Firmicutes bacterium HGW-Firmicutes-12]
MSNQKKIAFIFPGQGSQYVGMGKDIFEKYSAGREVFRQADEKLGINLSEMCFSGPEESLKLTINTQPAIVATSVAILSILQEEGIEPDYTAGHSLGEYTALVAAGAISFTDAIQLVRQRGSYMQEAVPPGEGTMAAIVGLDKEKVEEICLLAGGEGQVEIANYNSPAQIVIAGKVKAVQKAVELAKATGAKMAVMLSVSGPFHSSLLKPASIKLKEALEMFELQSTLIPVMANVNAKLTSDPKTISTNLINQVSSAVLWYQSIENLIALGTTTFVEIGPGKVLTGLIKKIDKNVEMYNIENETTLQTVLPVLKGA